VSRVEPWLLCYGLLGLTQSGLVPVLMPLVEPHGAAAGVTFAAFSLSGVLAPILGGWADATGRHRDLLICGTLGAGALLLLYDDAAGPLRFLLAAGAGLGCMAATTAGNVVATMRVPQSEWEGRIALLQRFTSAGQVIGLVAAGIMIRRFPGSGFVGAGLTLLAAGALALAAAPARDRSAIQVPFGDPDRHKPRRFAAALAVIDRPMRRFLFVWLIAYSAMNGFAALFPVAMTRQFGMDPVLPAGAYAVGVGCSLGLYSLVGAATHRLGSGRVLMGGFAARAALLAVLAALGLSRSGWTGWLVLAGFALVQFVWPLLAVAANALSVRLAPTARGESVGLFNAATSVASAIGSAIAGVIFNGGGFAALASATLAAVGAGLVLGGYWLRQPHPVAAPIRKAVAESR
jgi:MFS transporter, DHA1 family, tetracycline resistance protein